MNMRLAAAALVALCLTPALARADDLPTLYETYLDLSDPTAVTYVTDQLTAAGLSSADYPTLYSTLQASQQIYASANAQGINIPQVVVTGDGQSLSPIYVVVPSYAATSNALSAESVTSVPNNPTTAVQTIGIYSGDTAVVSPQGDITVGGTAHLLTGATGAALPGVTSYTAEGASTFIYPATVLGEANMAALNLTADDDIALAQATDMPFTTSATTITITNTAPVDTKNVGYIKVCLVRSDSDCSYTFPQVNGKWIVEMPLSGSATFSEAIKTDSTGAPVSPAYSVAIYYPDVGGGCTMPNTAFASQVTINGATATWNANPGVFGPVCSDIPGGVTVDVVYQLVMGFQGVTGSPLLASVTSEQGSTVANVYRTEPMEFVYGCLAPGTLITLADGTSRAIEKIAVGDRLRGLDGRGLEVTSYTKGPETKRLFTIITADGKSVRMTEAHPVPLADGTVKQAHKLLVGDRMSTAAGPVAITKLTEAAYSGDVWNLAVGGPQQSKATLDTASHAFFANGLLVGDARAQAHYSRRQRNDPQEILAHLPARWHRDFDSAQKRNSARQ